jgi:hypothetical protein
MDKYEAADLIEAAYAHASDWYSGMSCPLYARLCELGRVFKPGPCWSTSELGDGVSDWYSQIEDAYTTEDLPLEAQLREALASIETAEF